MLRGVGAVLMTAAGLWLGWELSRFWAGRRRMLESCGMLLQTILDAVQYRRLPAGEILAEIKQQPAFAAFVTPDSRTLRELAPPCLLTGEQARHFTNCMQSFGSQGLSAQCEQLRREIAYFDRCADEVRGKEQAAAALCPRVGLSLGGMLALALL